jgi:2-oxoglutarate dehydrogenase E2 component (dihydrolipoamide succinyltransferase)
MGVSVSEGTVTRWVKQVGDLVKADETLLEISTDKVDTEVPSPVSGTLLEVLVQEGETVEVGAVLARLGDAEAVAGVAAFAPSESAADDGSAPFPPTSAATAAGSSAPPPPAPIRDGKIFVSPVVGRIAAAYGIDPGSVPGTGGHGRVTKKDVLSVIAAGADAESSGSGASTSSAPTAPAPGAPAPNVAAPIDTNAGEALEPMNAMRRGIADHMRRSLDTSAHVTSAIEVDMTRVARIREALKREYQASYGVNPTYLAFIARVTVETLRDYPWVNGEIRGDQIVTKNFVNLGFAVELVDGKGLIVPVVKNAELLNLLGMARAIVDIAQRARAKQLTPDDVANGSFTITSPGGYGSFHGTPVISQPQAAILGTYAVVKRPWVISDENGADAIAIRAIMNATLTYDHRLVDGAYAGRFLGDLRNRLEGWGKSDY